MYHKGIVTLIVDMVYGTICREWLIKHRSRLTFWGT